MSQDLSILNPIELKNFYRTGIYFHAQEDVQYLETPVPNNNELFLNGNGEFTLPTSGYTGTVVISNKTLTFKDGILKTVV